MAKTAVRGVDPAVWGPHAWNLIHAISFRVAAKPRLLPAARRWFLGLQEILPCPRCRVNLAKHMQALGMPRKAAHMPQWAYDLHDRVSRDVGGAKDAPTMAEVAARWEGVAWPTTLDKLDALPFVSALVETHLGMRGVTEAYVDATVVFWTFLMDAGICEVREIDVALLRSRPGYRAWTHRVCRAKTIKATCNADACALPTSS